MAKETSSTGVPEQPTSPESSVSSFFSIITVIAIIIVTCLMWKKIMSKKSPDENKNKKDSSGNGVKNYNEVAKERAVEGKKLKQIEECIKDYNNKIENYNIKVKEWNTYLVTVKPYSTVLMDIVMSLQPFVAFARCPEDKVDEYVEELLNAKKMLSSCSRKLKKFEQNDSKASDGNEAPYEKCVSKLDKICKENKDNKWKIIERLKEEMNNISNDQARLQNKLDSREIHTTIKKILTGYFSSIINELVECSDTDSATFREVGKRIPAAFESTANTNCRLRLLFLEDASPQEQGTVFELVSRQHLPYPAVYMNDKLYLSGCRPED